MKTARIGVLAAVLFALSGCITFLTEIHVRPDGSGTLVQTMTMNPQAMMGAMDAFAKGMGATGSGEVKETKEEKKPFSPSELAEKTKDLGEGVTFVSADEIKTPTAEGVRVTYAFRDINRLYVNPKPGAATGMEGAGRSARNAMTFRFERKGDRSILTAVLPPNADKKNEAPPTAPSGDIDDQQLAMLKQMFKGMHLGFTVEVDGRITSTTSPFRSGNRVTLFDLDFDPLLEKPETLKALNASFAGAMGDDAKAAAALSKVPGLKIDPKPEVRIEFAAR